jgi:hypothetical protein
MLNYMNEIILSLKKIYNLIVINEVLNYIGAFKFQSFITSYY